MSRLALYLLGHPRIELDGSPLQVGRRKATALLAYLVVTGQGHSRDALATLFWPEHDQSQARAGLRRALASLRKALGQGWLYADRESVALEPDAQIWLDVAEFQDWLAECRKHGHPLGQTCPDCLSALAEAATLYRDGFLAGFTLRDCPGFDEWQFFQTEALRDDLASALERLVHGYSAQGEFEPAIAYGRRWVGLDQLHEPAHRCLMQLYASSGQRAAAVRQYGECERVLREELGVPPDETTVRLYQTIKEHRELPPLEDRAEALLTTREAARKHNLPVQPTPFVGRETFLREIAQRLQDPECRLLTLVGPGGSGKTRLALEAAAARLEDQAHGVYLVSLAPLDSSEAIVPTVAQALGFSFYAATRGRTGIEPEQQLLDYLRQKSVLLVLDNFEHLLDGVSLVTNILRATTGVKIVATSRARLNVQGEHLFPVSGMDLPDWEGARDAEEAPVDTGIPTRYAREVAQYSAVKLFVQCARRVQPGFELVTDNLMHIVRICHLVQGMPLGIVLAAGWLGMLTPAEVANAISQSLDFLATDLRDLPERQRSMRAVFDHSWKLLTEREREVFRTLSVFRGGFAAQAAEKVAGASLHDLRSLVDKSLLQRDPQPEGRYEMHELLRHYTADKLRRADKHVQVPAAEEAVKDRHCAYYASFLQQREAHLIGRIQKTALAEIEAESENVRTGWNWAVAQGKLEEIDLSLEGLAHFYLLRGWLQQGEELFARAAQRLAEEQESRPTEAHEETENRSFQAVLGKVLLHQGWFCAILGLVEKANELLQRSLVAFRDLGARRELAYALRHLGFVASSPEEGKTLLLEGLAIFEEIGDRRGIVLSLWALGYAAVSQGEYWAAKELFQETLTLCRELGNQQGIADSLAHLGQSNWFLGDYGVAEQLHQESLVLCKEINDSFGMAYSLNALALDAFALGEYGEAKQLFQASLTICREMGYAREIARALVRLGEVANTLGEHGEAIQLAQESLMLSKKLDAQFEIGWNRRVLGDAACGLRDFSGAKRYYYQALETATAIPDVSLAPLVLVGIASLLAAEGRKDRALELLSFVLHYPASWQWVRDRATSLIAEVGADLPPEVMVADRACGPALELEPTVAELLVELGD
jgi:predicted ATPase/DNA-binding SARP family transcriptional activator